MDREKFAQLKEAVQQRAAADAVAVKAMQEIVIRLGDYIARTTMSCGEIGVMGSSGEFEPGSIKPRNRAAIDFAIRFTFKNSDGRAVLTQIFPAVINFEDNYYWVNVYHRDVNLGEVPIPNISRDETSHLTDILDLCEKSLEESVSFFVSPKYEG